MTDTIWIGSQDFSNGVDLFNPEGFLTKQGGYKPAPYDPDDPPQPSGQSAIGDQRDLVITGWIFGGSANNRQGKVVLAIISAINQQLRRARLSLGNGDLWLVDPIVLAETISDAGALTYWDILGGQFDAGTNYGAVMTDAVLTLHVLPYGRQDRRSAVITTVSANTYYVGNVPGDATALTTLTLPDTSGGGRCINDWRGGVANDPDLLATDFTPIVEAVPGYPTVQVVSVGPASAGSFTLSFGGQTTGSIAYNASAAAVQTALTGLSSILAGNVTVSGSGSFADPWVVTFAGTLATSAQLLMTGTPTGLTGGTFAIRMLTGATFSDPTASGGTCIRVGQTDNIVPRTAAFVVGPGTGARQFGRFDSYIRMRDIPGVNSIAVPTLSIISDAGPSTGGDGTLDGTSISMCLTNLDAAGNESAPSAVLQCTTGGPNNSVRYFWTSALPTDPAPTSTRVYLKAGSGAWHYTASPIGPVISSTIPAANTTIGSATGTLGSPPTGHNVNLSPTQLTASTALNTPNPATASFVIGRGSSGELGNSRWEYVRQQPLRLSPAIRAEGLAERRWLMAISSLTANPRAYTFPTSCDIDHVVLFPHGREPQLHMWHSTLDMATPRTWIADYRRDERMSAVLTDGTNIQGQAAVEGSFALGPGGNIIVLIPTKQQRESDTSLSYGISIDYAPRFLYSQGLSL